MSATPTNTTTNVITNAFNKWADKTWFQVLFVVIIVYLLLAPIATPIITNYFQQINTSEAVTRTLDERDAATIEAHRLAFEKSKQAYALIKKEMQSSLSKIDCDYIFLLEYHNGSENVMTGVQFCKFDATLEVGENIMDLVPPDKLRNENIAKYDLLLSEDLNQNKLLFYRKNDFEKVDKYFAIQLAYLDAEAYTITTLKDKNNKIFGALLCISKNENMSTIEAMMLAREIETIINNSKLKPEIETGDKI